MWFLLAISRENGFWNFQLGGSTVSFPDQDKPRKSSSGSGRRMHLLWEHFPALRLTQCALPLGVEEPRGTLAGVSKWTVCLLETVIWFLHAGERTALCSRALTRWRMTFNSPCSDLSEQMKCFFSPSTSPLPLPSPPSPTATASEKAIRVMSTGTLEAPSNVTVLNFPKSTQGGMCWDGWWMLPRPAVRPNTVGGGYVYSLS